MKLPWYTTREAVKADLDMKETARSNAKVDRAIEGASRAIEAQMHRVFYPHLATRRYDWPNSQLSASYGLWLDDEHQLISVTTLTSGGDTVPADDVFLYPDEGPPYDQIQLDRSSDASWTSGDTPQRSIVVEGLFGWTDDHETVATLVAGIDADDTELTVSNSPSTGVGSLLRIGSERLLVTDKKLVDSGFNLQSAVDGQAKTTLIPVGSTDLIEGEVILVDSEKMLITDVAGSNLIVKRAWDGTVLASHSSSADVYVDRRLVVQRASVGSEAASHSLGATIQAWLVPGLLEELCSAEALNTLLQKTSAYARTTGSGDNEREASGRALKDVRQRAEGAYRRWRS